MPKYEIIKMVTENKIVSWAQMLEWLTGNSDVSVLGPACDGDAGLSIDQTAQQIVIHVPYNDRHVQ